MEIRYAQKEDVVQIIELCEAHAKYEKATYSKHGKSSRLADYLFNQDDVLNCLVVEENDCIVGYATFMKQFSTWDAGYYLYLDCIFLKSNVRGKGIGYELMKRMKEVAIQKKYSRIEWQTPDFNDKAINFYNKIGALPKSKERFCWEFFK